MPPPPVSADRHALASLTLAAQSATRFIADPDNRVNIADLKVRSCFDGALINQLRNKSVLLATIKQLPTVLALLELAGVARRVLLCPPDTVAHLPAIIGDAEVDAVVTDGHLPALDVTMIMGHSRLVSDRRTPVERTIETEWVLFTSGTTGRPKMVQHTLPSLSGPLADGVKVASHAVWSTFYDVRRYGGLQILLRALIGGGSMVLSDSEEAVGAFLQRLGQAGVTHISGTPSHWRRVLMSPAASVLAPGYVRLSGEVADQTLLDRLRQQYPEANIAHAFASTEAGVGFDVRDGLAGFPCSFVPHPNQDRSITLRIEDGTLRIRSSRTAIRYLGQPLRESEGFIDTGDVVEQRGDRYLFIGRREGVINVGGQKVYPDEIEDILNRHPDVLIARVWPRKNPIVGSIVAADVVLQANASFERVREALQHDCRAALPAYKVPVTWQQVDTIAMSVSGKVERT